MKILPLTIEFLSYWHAGSGNSGTGDVDAAINRDSHGLPYIPGRTLKGLFRDATELRAAWIADSPQAKRLFGSEGGEPHAPAGILHFADAGLPTEFVRWVSGFGRQAILGGLVETIASTALEDTGIAREHSLRKIEYAIPMELHSTITWESCEEDQIWAHALASSAKLIRRLGLGRHRGFGRCTIKTGALTGA